MPHLPYHPAIGLAEMMPGTWTVPQNPIEERAVVVYKPKLGEMMPAFFPLPENPLMNALQGCNGLGGGCGGGCGCGPRCQVGMGELDVGQTVTDWWEGLKAGNVSSILVAAAVAVGGWILLSGGRYKR